LLPLKHPPAAVPDMGDPSLPGANTPLTAQDCTVIVTVQPEVDEVMNTNRTHAVSLVGPSLPDDDPQLSHGTVSRTPGNKV
jgi:hypothetical protein